LSCDVLRDAHGVREHLVLLHLSGRMSPLAVVIADTHLPRRANALPEDLIPHLERADLILHAGDLMEPTLLDELAAYATVRAVRGNLDPPAERLPETAQFEFGGVRVAMIHDSGPKRGRRNRMRLRFPEARVVVFGHSHIPWSEDEEGLLLLNPGSPTDRRRQPEHTFALLRVKGGEVRAEVLAL
jgi:putative phosphoesterase